MKLKRLGLTLFVAFGPLCAMEPKTAAEMDAFAQEKVQELTTVFDYTLSADKGLAEHIADLQSIAQQARNYAKKVVTSYEAYEPLVTYARDVEQLIACYEEEASLMIPQSEPSVRSRDSSPALRARPNSPGPSAIVDAATLEDTVSALPDIRSRVAPQKKACIPVKNRPTCSLSQQRAQEYDEAEAYLQAQLLSLEDCALSPEVQQLLEEIKKEARRYAQDSEIYTSISERFQSISICAQGLLKL